MYTDTVNHGTSRIPIQSSSHVSEWSPLYSEKEVIIKSFFKTKLIDFVVSAHDNDTNNVFSPMTNAIIFNNASLGYETPMYSIIIWLAWKLLSKSSAVGSDLPWCHICQHATATVCKARVHGYMFREKCDQTRLCMYLGQKSTLFKIILNLRHHVYTTDNKFKLIPLMTTGMYRYRYILRVTVIQVTEHIHLNFHPYGRICVYYSTSNLKRSQFSSGLRTHQTRRPAIL